MILSHRIALDPTAGQRQSLARACGVARFTWNWALAKWEQLYKSGEKPTAFSLKKQWNAVKREQYPWVYDSPKDANQQPFTYLSQAYSRFFQKKAGRPRFKRKGRNDSFYISNDKFSISGRRIRLPRIGAVRTREALRFTGKIVGATVSRQANRWFVSIQVEVGENHLPETDKSVGLDMGLKTAIVCSDGQQFHSPRPLRKRLKMLARENRRLARKKKGSNRRWKQINRLSRLHAKIRNIRHDWAHKVTTKLINENQVICVEDLNVSGMIKNRRLSRAISDVGWYALRQMLEYKSRYRGRRLAVIDRWTPTTKACSQCGCVRDMQLSERTFNCDECGYIGDRDLNAAINIRTAGLAGTYARGPESSGPSSIGVKLGRVEAGTKPVGAYALTN